MKPVVAFALTGVALWGMWGLVGTGGPGFSDPPYPVERREVVGHYRSKSWVEARTIRVCPKTCLALHVPAGWRFAFAVEEPERKPTLRNASSLDVVPSVMLLEGFVPEGSRNLARAERLAPGEPVRLSEVVHPFGADRPPRLEAFSLGTSDRDEGVTVFVSSLE